MTTINRLLTADCQLPTADWWLLRTWNLSLLWMSVRLVKESIMIAACADLR
jgi:hypothetical protein